MMLECGFDSLAQLSEACLRAAPLGGSTGSGPNGLRRPDKSPEVRKLIVERKACRDPALRQAVSKSITKAMKKELRAWKTTWTEDLLQRFRNTGFLQKINLEPVKQSACPIGSETFAGFFEKLLHSGSPLPTAVGKHILQDIDDFSIDELVRALC